MKIKFFFFFFLIFFSSFSLAQNFSSLDPAEVKTAFVYNFLKFVTWPDNEDDEFLFCVVGKTDLLPYLLDLDGQPYALRTFLHQVGRNFFFKIIWRK